MAKYLRLILVGCLVGFGGTLFIKMSSAASGACDFPYRKDVTIRAGTNTVYAELANTPEKQTKGLSGRSCIGAEQGMLFTYDKPGTYDFWMKDMKFPIDIVWINENKTVIGVERNLSPSTYPETFSSKNPVRYVLELQSGRAARLNMAEGTTLRFNLK